MDLEEKLNMVGKAVFVKYFYVFANMSYKECREMFTENFTKKSKRSRTSLAKAIFREGQQFEALKIVCRSPSIDRDTKLKAETILCKLNRKKGFFL